MKSILGAAIIATTLPLGAAFAGSLDDAIATPVVTAPPAPAPAAPVSASNFYASLAVGGSLAGMADANQPGVNPNFQNVEQELETGFGLSGALGYELSNNLRIEGEILSISSPSGDQVFPDADFDFTTEGDYRLTAGMINGWYSFGSGQIKPFLGGGIGYGRVTVDLVNEVDVAVDDSADAFTWQVGAGVEYGLSESISLIGTYRYVAAPDLELEDTDGDAFTADFSTQFASVGVLYRF